MGLAPLGQAGLRPARSGGGRRGGSRSWTCRVREWPRGSPMRGGVGVPRSGWGSRDHPPMTRSRVLHAAPRPLPPAQGVLPGAASGSAGGRGSSPLGRGLGEQGLWVWGGQQKRIGPRPGRRCPGWSSRACRAAREKPGQPRSISAWLGEDAERLRRCWRDAQREGSGRETGGQGSLV